MIFTASATAGNESGTMTRTTALVEALDQMLGVGVAGDDLVVPGKVVDSKTIS